MAGTTAGPERGIGPRRDLSVEWDHAAPDAVGSADRRVTLMLVGFATALALAGVASLQLVVAAVLMALILPLAAIVRLSSRQRPPVRVAVIGDAVVAERLRRDLERSSRRYAFAGRIAVPGTDEHLQRALAPLYRMRAALLEHQVQVLVLSSTAPREAVYAEFVSRCLDMPVRLVELPRFYETTFGYVPASEMNALWFQCLVDPSWRFPHPLVKRAIDIVGATALAVPALPLCLAFILLIRRDGGPGLFRQRRIGEGGRPFTMYKLRTMRTSNDTHARWAAVDDARVTPIGRFLRCTHFDELPQLLNVLRGEMSLVGPRPEQPAIVEQLECEVPFYQRRHLIRPGLTGWAQIRCGYARSDSGSAWKHCHDLYYLKHRSIRLDLRILAATAWLMLVGAVRKTEAILHSPPPAETVVWPLTANGNQTRPATNEFTAPPAPIGVPRAAYGRRLSTGRRAGPERHPGVTR